MFTGLIEGIGTVETVEKKGEGKAVSIELPQPLANEVSVGDSIAINGVCSTATQIDGRIIQIDYLKETLDKTTCDAMVPGDKVNLELALLPTKRIGGHFVTGHVDTPGKLTRITRNDDWGHLEVAFPLSFLDQAILKGSITIDGISLTITELAQKGGHGTLACELIPHTWQETTLQYKSHGDAVNLEFDMLLKKRGI